MKTRDINAAQATLRQTGYDVQTHEDRLFVTSQRAVQKPEEIASVLVHAGVAPILLKVETEDLEAYFLRRIRERRSLT